MYRKTKNKKKLKKKNLRNYVFLKYRLFFCCVQIVIYTMSQIQLLPVSETHPGKKERFWKYFNFNEGIYEYKFVFCIYIIKKKENICMYR